MKKTIIAGLVFLFSYQMVFSAWLFDQPIAFYPLSNNATDQSGNNYNGIASGVAFNGNHSTFDGIDDYISVSDNDDTNLLGNYTLSIVVRQHIVGAGSERILIKDDAADYVDGWSITVNNGNINWDHYGSSGSPANDWDTTIDISANEWTTLTMTYNGSTIRAYQNGTLINSRQITYGYITNNDFPFYFGRYSGGQYFDGDMKNVILYDVALNDSQVLELYNNEGDPRVAIFTTNLQAYYNSIPTSPVQVNSSVSTNMSYRLNQNGSPISFCVNSRSCSVNLSTGIQEGNNSVEWFANSNNVLNESFVLDLTDPVINFTNITQVFSYRINWTLIFNYSDENMDYSDPNLCKVNNVSCKYLYNFSIAGNHTVNITVFDLAGNNITQNRTISINPFQEFHARDSVRDIPVDEFSINGFSTTNGTVRIPLFSLGLGNQTLNISGAGFVTANYTIPFNLTSDYNLTLNLSPASIIISIYDETTSDPLGGVNLFISNTTVSLSYSDIQNITLFINESFPLGNVEFEFSRDNYSTRSYFSTLTEESIINLDAYLLPVTEGTFVSFFVYDSSSNILEDALIEIYQRINETDVVVEQAQTDAAGFGGVFLDLSTELQFFIVIKDGYVQQQYTIRPTTTEYKVYLESQLDLWRAWDDKVSYRITPKNNVLYEPLELNYTIANEDNDFTIWGFKVYNVTNDLISHEYSTANSGGSLFYNDISNSSILRIDFYYQIGSDLNTFRRTFKLYSTNLNYSAVSIPALGNLWVEDDTLSPGAKLIIFTVLQIFVIAMPHTLDYGRGKGIYFGWAFLLAYAYVGAMHWGLAAITIIGTALMQFDAGKRGFSI